MKFLKRYNEDINIDFDNIDEEEYDDEIRPGDYVRLKKGIYPYTVCFHDRFRLADNYENTKNTESIAIKYSKGRFKVDVVDERNDGEKIIKLDVYIPWYVANEWEKIN